MSASLEIDPTAVNPEGPTTGVSAKEIEGRSLGRIAWNRLKRDKVALAGGVVVILFILVGAFAPLILSITGKDPNAFNYDQLDPDTQLPRLAYGGIFSPDHWFGVEPINGRDLFARIVAGSRISLVTAFLATLLSVVIGTTLGIIAGYVGGWVDTLISRTMDIFLAFPLVLFALALVGALPTTAFGLTGDTLRIGVIVFIIGFFNWPYVGRIVRGQAMSLRQREFVDASLSLGARTPRILFKELLPNLFAPILVYATLLIPTNILFEAALSYLGVGVQPPTPTWGGMLSDASDWAKADPWFMVPPGLAIFVTVLAFNLFGDGLRDALDPKTR